MPLLMNGCPLLAVKPLTPSLCRRARSGRPATGAQRREVRGCHMQTKSRRSNGGPVLCSWTRDALDQVLQPQRGSRGGQQTPGHCSSSHQCLNRAAVRAGWLDQDPPGVRNLLEQGVPTGCTDTSRAAAVSPSNREKGSDPCGGGLQSSVQMLTG